MTVDIGLGNWLYRRSVRTPHPKALTFEGTTWTYGELQDRIDHLAGALRAHGVCRGDRVAFLGFNQPALLETLFAAAGLGAIFVPLNFRLAGPEHRAAPDFRPAAVPRRHRDLSRQHLLRRAGDAVVHQPATGVYGG